MPAAGVAARKYDAERRKAKKLPAPEGATNLDAVVDAWSPENWRELRREIERRLRRKLGHKRQLDHSHVDAAVSAGVSSVVTYWLVKWAGKWDGDEDRFRLAAHHGAQRALDAFKKEDRQQRRELTREQGAALLGHVDFTRPARSYRPTEQAALRRLVRRLPAREREVIQHRLFTETPLTLVATAAKVGVGVATVKRDEAKALARLRAWLDEEAAQKNS